MKSKWFEYKEAAIALRKTGISMTVIERQLGIPRSTLSGWFKSVKLTEAQRTKLMKNKSDGWAKARQKAVESHKARKALRLEKAKKSAQDVLEEIDLTSSAILELAFAMLYLGEGAKTGGTSIASSDPMILRFVLSVLRSNYGLSPTDIRCDLHLRMDQDEILLKDYWSKELNIPIGQFKYVAFDKRSEGKATFSRYKGVCVISCGRVDIQRKIMYLYTLFCEKVSQTYTGA